MTKPVVKRRTRAPDATREKLLNAAFEEIHRRGFQAASLDTILAGTGMTKGALYHHFPDKLALGYAVIDEVIRDMVLSDMITPLERGKGDPLTTLQRIIRVRGARATAETLQLGCPLNNLAQEMSPLDEHFRQRVSEAFEAWRDAFANALERGQADGIVREDVDARKVASFIVASIEGSIGLAKNAKSLALLRSNFEILGTFVESLRAR
jgi:TetR/AcrR family transcriptional repressor of nem operon